MEGLWANLKDVELANRPTTTLAEVADATEQGIQRICKHQDLVLGFLAHTGLTLDPSAVNPPTKLNERGSPFRRRDHHSTHRTLRPQTTTSGVLRFGRG